MRYHFIPIRMVIIEEKKEKITSIGQDVEKLESLCIANGNIKWWTYCLIQYANSSKIKHGLPCNPVIPLLGI